MLHIDILATLNPDRMATIQHVQFVGQITVVSIGLIGQTHYVALHEQSATTGENNTQAGNTSNQHSNDDEDQRAFDEMVTTRGLPYETCMQEDSTHDAYHVYSIAPGENQRPRAFLTDENLELMANPNKYPRGYFCLFGV